jgi:serine/threonine protein kinase
MCPDIDVLRDLIHGTLPNDDEAAVTEHLGTCPGCQYRFDQMAGPDDFVDRVPQLLVNSAVLTVLDDALDQLEAESAAGLPPFPGSASKSDRSTRREEGPTDEFSPCADVEKWFEPTDEPELLGVLGGYDIMEFIGRGGMGVVFRGRDRSLDRTVAIKVLAPSLATNHTSRERFLREARSAAAINHANVATVHAVEESAQLPYLVMEYVEGESLRQRLDQVGRLELKEIIRVGYQVASGLDAAHAQGIVHRDIKPGNILLETATRRARLTDFGLARITTDNTLTQTGMLVGTPGYIAPEVASGHEADHRADLFSFGCLLYVMATGELPFPADSTMQTLRRVVDEEATPVQQLNPDIPNWLDELIAHLLQKDPAHRPQSAAELKRVFKQRYRELKDGSSVAGVPQSRMGFQPVPSKSTANSTPPVSEESISRIEVPADTSRLWYAVGGAALLAVSLSIATWLGGDQSTTDAANPGTVQTPVASARAEPLVVVPIAVNRPFLVSDDRGNETSFDTFEQAIRAADDGDIIVIRDDGPFETTGIEIHQDELIIVAAPGCRPVIRLVGEDELSGELFTTHERLELRGLELRLDEVDDSGAAEREDVSEACLVRALGGSFEAINCRFVVQPTGACIVAEHVEQLDLVNCELHAPRGHILSWSLDEHGEARVRNCVATAETAFFLDGLARDVSFEIGESTILAGKSFWLNLEPSRLDDDEPGLEIRAERVVFDVDDMLAVIEPEFGRHERIFEQLHWHGEGNVFTGPFIGLIEDDDELPSTDDSPANLTEWAQLENVEESESISQRVEYAGSREEIWGAAYDTPQDPPVGFRLLDGGQIETRLGDTPGAHIEEVGPGPPYDEWLRHDEDSEDE